MKIRKIGMVELVAMLPMKKFEAFSPDIVVAVERGGAIPAAIIAYRLGLPLVSVKSSLYDDGKPARRIHSNPQVDLRLFPFHGKKALIVDDISNSGATLNAVKAALLAYGAESAVSYALFGKSDLSSVPFEGCVKFPWEA